MPMAKTLTEETLEELAAAYMELPWLDEIRLGQGQGYSVTVIPSDDVSMDEKLLTFVDAEHQGSSDTSIAARDCCNTWL